MLSKLTAWLTPDSFLAFWQYHPDAPWLFTSTGFVVAFMFFLTGYYFINRKLTLRTAYVLAFSLFFYFKTSGWFVALLAISTLIDFLAGLALHRAQKQGTRKLILVLSLFSNLGMLGYFKYANWFREIVLSIIHLSPGVQPVAAFSTTWDIILPVGISFFTFQTMSYTIDVYRRNLEPCKSLLDFAFFVSFFPQLVAGPIVRASEFLDQIRREMVVTREDLSRALWLIGAGIFKKTIISDYLSVNLVDRVFDNPLLYSGFETLSAVYGYALQIYCDFSGYSDIAIGLGLLMGFRLPANFLSPYQSVNIQEFWRRWHMSLSSWLRDYLYISLGGNRKGKWRTRLNLILTMLLGGLWHGASWKFVLWGGLHGLALSVENLFRKNKPKTLVPPASKPSVGENLWGAIRYIGGVLLTFHFVCFCWIFFRAADMNTSFQVIQQIGKGFAWQNALEVVRAYRPVFVIMGLGYLLHFIPDEVELKMYRFFAEVPSFVQAIWLGGIFWLMLEMRTAGVTPFIYFQF